MPLVAAHVTIPQPRLRDHAVSLIPAGAPPRSAKAGVWGLERAELLEDFVGQANAGGGYVFFEVLWRRGSWDGQRDRRAAQQPCKRHLHGRGVDLFRNP